MSLARHITNRLKGDWHGTRGLVPGPGHSSHDRSVSVTDAPGQPDGILVHCYSPADDWKAVKREWASMGFIPSFETAGNAALARTRKAQARSPKQKPFPQAQSPSALTLWKACRSICGTGGEDYLRARAIRIPLPDDLRFTPNYRGRPAIVAAVRNAEGAVQAVQIICLRRDFLDKDREAQGGAYRTIGSPKGGAIRLCPPAPVLGLVEGIEDALSVLQLDGFPCWAVTGTSALQTFVPPREVKTVALAPDADGAGAKALGAAAAHLRGLGVEVKHAPVPRPYRDWNDCLMGLEERIALMIEDGGLAPEDAEGLAREACL